MELSNGADYTNIILPTTTTGNAKIVPLNDGDTYDDVLIIQQQQKASDEKNDHVINDDHVEEEKEVKIEESVITPVKEKLDGDATEVEVVIRPHSMLPKPEAPPGLTMSRSQSLPESVKMPAIGKFFREKSSSLSSSISKKLSMNNVTEFNLSGLKVIVKLKDNDNDDADKEKIEYKGRITFFSKSNCRDCTAVRSFFRERNLR